MQRMCMPAGEDRGAAAQTAAVMRPDMDSFLQRGNLDGNSAVSKQSALVRESRTSHDSDP